MGAPPRPLASWVSILIALGIWATFATVLYIAIGGHFQVHEVRSELHSLNSKASLESWMSRFPSNQAELSARQIFATIENLHKISTRTHYLLERMEPGATTAMVGDVKTVVERLSNLLTGNTTDRLLAMVDQINRVPVKRVAEALAQFDVAKFNELVGSTRRIEEKLNQLHEIKIQI